MCFSALDPLVNFGPEQVCDYTISDVKGSKKTNAELISNKL